MKFGLTCLHPDPASADRDGAHACALVAHDGAIPSESGHATVDNWKYIFGARFPGPHTYLGYCAGNKSALGAAPVAEGKSVEEIEAEIEKAFPKR